VSAQRFSLFSLGIREVSAQRFLLLFWVSGRCLRRGFSFLRWYPGSVTGVLPTHGGIHRVYRVYYLPTVVYPGCITGGICPGSLPWCITVVYMPG